MPETPPKHESSLENLTGHRPESPQMTETQRARNRALRLSNIQPAAASELVSLPNENVQLMNETTEGFLRQLAAHYMPGIGVFPAADPSEAYYNNIYARDAAHFAGNYSTTVDARPALDSLRLILRYQKQNGELPHRVERDEYLTLKLFPLKPLRRLAKPVFNLLSTIRNTPEIPYYEGFITAEDTIPATIIAAGELFLNSSEGEQFVASNFKKLQTAVNFFRGKTDPIDSLMIAKGASPDWMDSLQRGGKLGGLNVWWARSLRLMKVMSQRLGHAEEAKQYGEEYRKIRDGVLKKLYNKEHGYFRASTEDDRLDTSASVFGALYLLNPVEAAKVEETLTRRVKRISGLANFDPPYPESQIRPFWHSMGLVDYHNRDVWPWVTLQNIQVKIKIATLHPDQAIKEQYKRESVEDLLDMARLFKDAGGAYEIFKPDERQPAIGNTYTPPKNLMGNMVSFVSAYNQLKTLGWI